MRRAGEDPDAYDRALREGLRVFDRLSERYGLEDGFLADQSDVIGNDARREDEGPRTM